MASSVQTATTMAPRASSRLAATSHSKEALREVNAVRELSRDTADEFDAQGERLVKAQRNIAEMHDDMNISERLIGGIESFWTAFANKFRFDNSKDNRRAQAKAEDEIERSMAEDDTMVAIAKHDADMEQNRRQMKILTERSSQMKTGISEVDDYFEETDRDLDDVYDALAEVKRNALRMRASMARDDKLLDRLQPEAARLEERIRKSNTKIDRIVK
eukprot:TRINITY_DN6541_c0_g1_i1.p1 TRINITY_DN6541_c0_g1~~TRINITY_DN6541_c0_g1_i1.p1  ORF type:complete len:217 (+),score=59.00 TRINITY_DN6541_c0_g1_i1:173-823(+)